MKYLLDQAEVDQLNKDLKDAKEAKTELIQRLCTEVCNHKPVLFWGNEVAEPWECIYPEDEDGFRGGRGYCDECPVQEDCPHPDKKWSK